MTTKIEWCDETINPFVGCTRISAGCRACYAIRFAWRHQAMFGAKDERYRGLVEKKNGRLDWTGKVSFFPERLEKIPGGEPKRIFIGSMGDLFHKDIGFSLIEEVYDTIFDHSFTDMELPNHTFLLLTKRPERMAEFLTKYLPAQNRNNYLPNLYLGVTVESQDQKWRVEELLKLRACAEVLFVSVEPMLGPVDLCGSGAYVADWSPIRKLDWVICGPENGPGKRTFDPAWAIDLRDQCRAAGVPFFFKGGPLAGKTYEEFPSG